MFWFLDGFSGLYLIYVFWLNFNCFCLWRPIEPLAWWEGGEIVGGRDGLAGGTWPACTRDGKVAFIPNAREVQKLAQAKSWGDLPVRFLEVIVVLNSHMFGIFHSVNYWQEVLFAYIDGILGALVYWIASWIPVCRLGDNT